MGLDMYLYLRKYESLGSWKEDNSLKVKDFYNEELADLAEEHYKYNFLSKDTRYQIGYWRKFNALHNWFVKNCAGGEDNCKPVYVDYEDFKKLKTILSKIKKDHNLAEELLPCSSGFFFGSQEYDEWYFEDIDYTLKLFRKIEPFIKEGNYDLMYEASW